MKRNIHSYKVIYIKLEEKENEEFKAKIKSAKIEYINRVEEKLENGTAGAVW